MRSDVGDWVAAARRGSQPAFAALYQRFLPLVHGILVSRWRPADADEMSQECFILAFARIGQLREPAHFGAWVASIARHLPPPAGRRESGLEGLESLPDAGSSPERRNEAAQVLHALSRLPEAYRETLALRLVEGLSGPEIAILTGLTPDSVRVNLHRGMRKLRVALGLDPAGELYQEGADA
jgi:RNA polymerase sigma-70 factor (ECF subfamily)